MNQSFYTRFAAILFVVFLTSHSSASELTKPQGEVILTVTGTIDRTNVGDTAAFDYEMLEALPQEQFTTSTIWTEGTHTFSGVSLKTLLETVGAKGKTLEAIAINDYKVSIPAEDAVIGGPIIAYLLDAKTMSVRDKGPLWIVYPYDQQRKYRTEVIYSRSIWQLKSINVLE